LLHSSTNEKNQKRQNGSYQMIVSKHTPVVGVNLFGITVALKIEMETAAYSHKARAIPFAVEMLKQIHGLGTRRFKLILSSSGNTARALAVYTAGIPIKLFIVADALSPIEQLKPLRQFGHVELIVVDCPDKSGSHMAARRRTISAMKAKFGDDLIELDQYRSAIFPFGYASSLAPEIESQVPNLSEIFVPAEPAASHLDWNYTVGDSAAVGALSLLTSREADSSTTVPRLAAAFFQESETASKPASLRNCRPG
jgi:cysteine synthase